MKGMRWQGQRQSTNIEDRRGMRVTRRGAVGGGLGLLAVMLIGMFLGVDPRLILGGAQIVNSVAPQTQVEDTGPYQETAEEAEERQFMAVVLADTEDVWGAVFQQGGATYRQPKLVLFNGVVESACGIAESAMGPFYCPPDERVFLDTSFFDEMSQRMGAQGDSTSWRTRSAITCRTCSVPRARCTTCSSATAAPVPTSSP